jgi:hypothetical protein
MIFRIHFKVLGDHVHCRLFVAKSDDTTFAKCGTFIVSVGEEFIALLAAFSGADFIGDDPWTGIEVASGRDPTKKEK